MSLNIESPESDNKMDISDATISQESTGVSPIADNDILLESPNRTILYETQDIINFKEFDDTCQQFGIKKLAHNLHYNDQLKIDDSNEINGDEKNIVDKLIAAQMEKNQLHLDNRFIDGFSETRLEQQQFQKTIGGLTLANSHPLMSPTATDSDSENSYNNEKIRNNQKFPDIVPNNEHHHSNNSLNVLQKQRLISEVTNNKTSLSLLTTKNAINRNSTNFHMKSSILRAPSPDIISSESEPEVSQYHTTVEVNFQSVALVSNHNSTNICHKTQTMESLKIATGGAVSDDSLDSISNHSFDDNGMEHNLASLSPSSSLMEGLNIGDDDYDAVDQHDDFRVLETPTDFKISNDLPVYSAEDETRDLRNWQKITLPDGRTREIDMRVIEPYKRVLSHGGYLHAGGHNAIVIFCACHLPDRGRTDYHYVMDNLFLYVVKTLEQLVTEDYVLIYLHGGSNRRNFPPFPWLKKCYQLLDRRLRKSLKNLYLVHPTFWIKSLVWMTRPFVSTKFWRKLVYVRSLEELGTLVSVEKAAIPDKVRQYDAKYN